MRCISVLFHVFQLAINATSTTEVPLDKGNRLLNRNISNYVQGFPKLIGLDKDLSYPGCALSSSKHREARSDLYQKKPAESSGFTMASALETTALGA